MAVKSLKASLLPSIKKLEISTRGFATGKFVGRYRSSFKGRGLEFDSYRSYTSDDDAVLIDWKASARTNEILVKQFVEERNLNVFLLMDVSASMLYGSSASKLKVLYASELTASLCYAILKAKDSVGYGLFNDHLLTYALPTLESQQFYKLCKSLLNTNYYGGHYNLEAAIEEVLTFLPDKTTLIIISDFIGVSGDWERKLSIAGKKFEIIGIMIRDLYDRTLPTDEINLLVEHPETDEQILVNPTHARRAYELHAREQEEYVKKTFKKSDGDLLVLTTDKPFAKPILTFFKMREMKWR